jgi:hypothetical protein
MKDEQLKNIWNMIDDKTGTFELLGMTKEQFISNRSASIQDKIRRMLQNDLILKMISGIAFLLNFLFYWGTPDVLYVCLAGILFLAMMTSVEWKTLRGFNNISDPGLPTRDALSSVLVFLKRKANLYELTIAASQILIFVPGLLIYFYLVYGQVKPMTGFSFFVYATLALIGTIMAFARVRAQIKFYIKHLTLCLSDLNENTIGYALQMIENQRKQDNLVKLLVALLLIFGFVAFIALLKSIVG